MTPIGRATRIRPWKFSVLPSPLRLPVRPAIFIPLSALNDVDFADLGGKVLAGVIGAEQARIQIRAQKSGLAIAGANTALPPMPGGRRG